MKCPVDNTTLTITDRQGVEIDFCPTCRGVWLDRGELDRLIERSEQFNAGRRPVDHHQDTRRYEEDRNYRHDSEDDDHEFRGRDRDSRHGPHGKHHKKESFLGDLFDF